MSPEQALGDANTDHRADLYAWGVVAWELLAGKHPFAQHTTQSAMVGAHIRRIAIASIANWDKAVWPPSTSPTT